MVFEIKMKNSIIFFIHLSLFYSLMVKVNQLLDFLFSLCTIQKTFYFPDSFLQSIFYFICCYFLHQFQPNSSFSFLKIIFLKIPLTVIARNILLYNRCVLVQMLVISMHSVVLNLFKFVLLILNSFIINLIDSYLTYYFISNT